MEIVDGYLQVGTNGEGEVVVNHPDTQLDEFGCGHFVFSVQQARNFALLVLQKADDAEEELNAKKR